MLLPWRRIRRQSRKQPLARESAWTAVTLTSLLLLWNLAVPVAIEQQLLDGAAQLDQPSSSLMATPSRQPPLQESAWSRVR